MTPLHFDYPISVAILYYGGEAEDLQDNVDAALNLKEALEKRGHVVRTVKVDSRNWKKAVKLPGEVVFNLVEDEDWKLYTKVGRRLEETRRVQVGRDGVATRYEVHKARIKQRMQHLGLSTPRFRVFNRRSDIRSVRGLEYPLIVKPSRQHAGIGISQDSVVIDQTELEERVRYLFGNYGGRVVVEEYVEGRELSITLMGNGKHVVVLPFTEREFRGEFADNWDVYTYDAKWNNSSWEYWSSTLICPAEVNRVLTKRIERLCLAAYRAFSCRDIARFDIRVSLKDIPYLVDVNMNPGIDYHEHEETWRAADALGWDYEEFVETLVAIAYKRMYGRLPDRIRERQLLLEA